MEILILLLENRFKHLRENLLEISAWEFCSYRNAKWAIYDNSNHFAQDIIVFV